ncbi:MAG: 2-oxoacid:acceptor oxidoreductase family protein [Candidatus Odinarchaeota archaeon]
MIIKSYTIVITGIGGQGLIKFIQILGKALMEEGFDVISSETHGLSQRGGKVTCYLRFGHESKAPIPMIGTADMIIALEESTIIDILKFAKPDKSTVLIVSTYEKHIPGTEYPSIQDLLNHLYDSSNKIYLVPAMEIARIQTGNSKTMNSVIIGYIAKFLPLKKRVLEGSIRQHFSGENLKRNLKAFNEGLKL